MREVQPRWIDGRRCLPRLVLAVLVFEMCAALAAAGTVRGQLFRVAPNGARYPATGVPVTISSPSTGRSAPAYSGSDGMYYLFNIPPGGFNLEVWVWGPSAQPLVFGMQVLNQPVTDIAPIQVP